MRPAATAHRATTRAAALLWLVTLFLTAGALVVDRTRVVDAVTFLAFPTVGAFVAARRPNNPVGWILCVLGLPWGIERFGANYATYALVTAPGALPAPEMLAWLASWQWIVIAGLVQALLLFFPRRSASIAAMAVGGMDLRGVRLPHRVQLDVYVGPPAGLPARGAQSLWRVARPARRSADPRAAALLCRPRGLRCDHAREDDHRQGSAAGSAEMVVVRRRSIRFHLRCAGDP